MGGVEATAKDMPSPTRAVDAARRADGAAADASFTSHDASLSSPLSVGGAVFHAPMEHAGLSFSPSPTRVNAAADGTLNVALAEIEYLEQLGEEGSPQRLAQLKECFKGVDEAMAASGGGDM